MIRITLIYRRNDDSYFDFDYYVNHHIKSAARLLADYGLSSIEIEKCVRTFAGQEPDIACMSHLDFENEEGFSKALQTHGPELKADFSNYTNIEPDIYVCHVIGNND